ncbi:MAG: carboxymuconolactone decarboxylase family protein [Pseudomonadota bacterium]
MDRLGAIAWDMLTDEQRAVAQAVIDGPRGALYGPFIPLLRSPELLACTQRMGEYLRFRSSIGPHLTELAILITASHWKQPVEWAIHAPIAAKAGIADIAIEAIRRRQRPPMLTDDEAAVYDFCIELHETKRVSDSSYTAALARFGEKGVVDLMGISGYYTLLAMVMNAAQTAVP